MIITPELIQDINNFIAALNDRFSPPQFIPGCLVKSVADKDEYATNNGWIEAICGQHNQQRVRWKSNDTVAINDFIDVLYFPDRRLFEAYGLGGSTPIPSSGGGWPFIKVHTVSPTDTDAQYSSIASAITAASAGDIILIDAGSYTEQLTVNKALSLVGLSPQQTIITIGTNDSITVDITAANVTLRNLKIANTGAGTTTINVRTNSNNTLLESCLIEKISGVPTTAIGIRSIGGTPNIIRSCDFNITTGTTKRLIVADTAATSVVIEHGTLDGSGVSVYTNHASAVVTLNYPRVLTSAPSNNAGLLQGHYLQTNGHVVTLQGSGRMGQCWIHQADGFVIYYNTIATALAASGAGDIIFIGAGIYYEQLTVSLAVTLIGLDPQNTIITYDAGATVALTGVGASLRNLTIENTGAGGTESTCVQWDVNNVVFENCILIKTGAASTASCFLPYGGTGWKIINCDAIVSGATTNYALRNNTATTSGEIRSGKLNGTTQDVFGDQSGSTITLNSVYLVNGTISFSGTIRAIPVHTKSLTTEFFSKFGGLSSSNFVSTISSKSGSTLVYGVVSAGNENNLANDGTGYAAKMLLWNTTRSEYLLIDQNNPGTNTITFTTAVPAGWTVGDTITTRSQTNTSNPIASVYFTDWEVSTDISIGTRAIELKCWFKDSALGAIVILHPYEANSNAKRDTFDLPVAGQNINQIFTTVPLISRRFCMAWIASGSGTLNISARLKGERAF